MAWRRLTDEQWEAVSEHLPKVKPRLKGGRPGVDDHRCFEGILWVLWAGAPWSEFRKQYASPATCWRRLKQWEEDGTLLELRRAFLAELADTDLIKWDEVLPRWPASPPRNRGARSRQNEARKGHKVYGSGRWRGYSAGSTRGLGVSGGGDARRADASERLRAANAQVRSATTESGTIDCGSRLRQQPASRGLGQAGHRADHPRSFESSQGQSPGRPRAPEIPTSLDRGADVRLVRRPSPPADSA